MNALLLEKMMTVGKLSHSVANGKFGGTKPQQMLWNNSVYTDRTFKEL